jgi:hypothetical protein
MAIAYLLDIQSYFSRVEFPITNEVRRLVLEQFAVGMPAVGTQLHKTTDIMESIEKKVQMVAASLLSPSVAQAMQVGGRLPI